MAHHGAAAVASIALPAEHVFAQLRAISIRTKALEIHTQGNRGAQIHVAAILECLRGLLMELSDTAFLAELAARQTKALLRVIDADAGRVDVDRSTREDPHG